MPIKSSKLCSICGLSGKEFNKNICKSDGLQTHCRDCNKERSHNHYINNKQKYLDRNHERQLLLRKYTMDVQRERGCIDCGENDPIVLEFDHIGNDKIMNISEMVHRGKSLSVINKEIAKCEVRCANCHRRKTAKDFEWYKFIDINY
jgi:hypothetical protein